MADPVTAVLALYLGSEVAASAVVGGLQALISLRERIVDTFQHAKTRTGLLIDAAESARAYVLLFEGTVEELQGLLVEPQRSLIAEPLKRLQQVVQKAEALTTSLRGQSKASWFVFGDRYRESLTKCTNEVCLLWF